MSSVFLSRVNLWRRNSWQTAERNLNCTIKNIWVHYPGGERRYISLTASCPSGMPAICPFPIHHSLCLQNKDGWLFVYIGNCFAPCFNGFGVYGFSITRKAYGYAQPGIV